MRMGEGEHSRLQALHLPWLKVPLASSLLLAGLSEQPPPPPQVEYTDVDAHERGAGLPVAGTAPALAAGHAQ